MGNERKNTKNFMNGVITGLTNPEKSKKDVLRDIHDMLEYDSELSSLLGTVDDSYLEMKTEFDELEKYESNYDGSLSTKIDLGISMSYLNIAKIDKSITESIVKIPSKAEARYLQDIYYQTQDKRLIIQNQIRAINQEKDGIKNEEGNMTFLEYYYYNTKLMEDQIKKALEAFTDSYYISRWAKKVIGIGPVIATCLAANLEITDNGNEDTDMHAGSWWSYCGLNDNNRPWIGKVESKEIIESVIADHMGIIDDSTVMDISAKTQWKFSHYENNCKNKNGTWSKDKLINYSCIVPYNKALKTLMYKIGHSFHMCKNKEKSLYGRLYKERFEYESAKNLNGDYADQAAAILKKKNIGKDTVAYKYYIKGQLPPAHITQRCERYVTKLFISHLFEAAYYNKYGRQCPNPYALLFCGHTDYIGPEVPYDSVERD